MTSRRCANCDREECTAEASKRAYFQIGEVIADPSHRIEPGSREDQIIRACYTAVGECRRHTIDWRTRALAAEALGLPGFGAEDLAAAADAITAIKDDRDRPRSEEELDFIAYGNWPMRWQRALALLEKVCAAIRPEKAP